MVGVAENMSNVMTDNERRYREAEATLWSAHGLEPIERWVELRDPAVRIRIVESGSGDPVLFLPGSGGSGPYWAPLVRELAGFRSLMLDRPGWGLSSPIDYRTDGFRSLVVRILAGVLDALELDRVDVIGASIGEIWALRLAQAHPSRVGKIVLLGGAPNRHVPIPTFIKLLRSPIGAVMVRMPMKAGMLRKQLIALGHGATVARGAMDDFIAWRLSFQRDTHSMRHERDMVRAITTAEGFLPGVTFDDGELGALPHPTMMLFGTEDPTGSAEVWRDFMNGIPHGELRLINHAGHQAWWDSPTEVAGHVRGFLGGVEPSPAPAG